MGWAPGSAQSSNFSLPILFLIEFSSLSVYKNVQGSTKRVIYERREVESRQEADRILDNIGLNESLKLDRPNGEKYDLIYRGEELFEVVFAYRIDMNHRPETEYINVDEISSEDIKNYLDEGARYFRPGI